MSNDINDDSPPDGESDATDGTALPESLDLDVRSVNATLLVSPDGVVRLYEVHTVGNAAGHPVDLTLSVSTDDLGTTSVEEPSWVEAAQNETAT